MLQEEILNHIEIIEKFKRNCGIIFKKGVRKFSDDKIVIVVSRKMVRLLDWILATDKSVEIPFPIITEHAIPFCFPRYKEKQVVVLDDSMFYGATLYNIHQVLRYCSGMYLYPKFYPIVARNREAADELDITDTYFIREKEIPLYTYTNSVCILSQNYPMEVEYPILTFIHDNTKRRSSLDVESVLRKHFDNAGVYTVSHKLFTKKKGNYRLSNYTVLLKPVGDSYSYDFTKFRVYEDGDILRVVPIAPIVLSNDVLNSDVLSVFQDTSFHILWDGVIKYLCNIENVSFPDVSIIEREEMEKEYELRKNKSLAVWANYLASYSKLLEYRTELNHFLNEFGYVPLPTFGKKDISILIGHAEIDGISITKMLSDLYFEPDLALIHKPRNNTYRWDNYIPLPQEYEEIYQKRNTIVWSKCKSITQALSYMISNRHYYVNKAFNELSPKRIEKSRYGVTFPYLLDELCNYGEERDKNKQLLYIHHWIDKKIDEGTVVPKFEQRYQKDTNTYYWRRYFKSGENEDALLHVIRVCVYIYNRIKVVHNTSYVRRRFFEELAITFFCNFSEYFNWGYSLSDSFDYKWDDAASEWRLFYHDEIVNQAYLLVDDLLCAQSYFYLEKVGDYDCIFICENSLTDYLGKALTMDEEMCNLLDDYITIYFSYTDTFTTCFNVLRKIDNEANHQVLREFKTFIREFLDKFQVTGKKEENLEAINQCTKILDKVYYQNFIPKVPLDSLPNNLKSKLSLSILKYNENVDSNNLELNDLLYKWELFLAIFEDKDMDQALLMLNLLDSYNVKLADVYNTLLKYNRIGEISSDVKNVLLIRIRSLF